MTVKKSFIIILIGSVLLAIGFAISSATAGFWAFRNFGYSSKGMPTDLAPSATMQCPATFAQSKCGKYLEREFGEIVAFPISNSEEISKIEIQSAVAELFVYTIDSKHFEVYAAGESKDTVRVSTKGKTFSVIEEDNFRHSFFDLFSFFGRKKHSALAVGIPKKLSLKSTIIVSGVGEIRIENIHSDFLRLELGVGEARIKNIRAEKARISSGIGETHFSNSRLKNATIEVGIGEFFFDGKLYGKTRVNTGIGETTFRIHAPQRDYNIRGKAGIGEVHIQNNASSFPLGAVSTSQNKDAQHEINIKGGIGEVSMQFTE